MSLKKLWVLGSSLSVAFALLTCVYVGLTEAQEERPSPLVEKGIGQYKHENYEEALKTLLEARKENPQSSLAAYYAGLTCKQMQDYSGAIPHLKDAVTYTPKIKGALIELIDAYFQIGQLDEAKKWITEAENEGIRPAQTAFLKGMILAKNKEYDDAIQAFTVSKELDTAVTQSADYQIGIINLSRGNFSGAKEIFAKVVLVNPTSTMANYANEYMDAIKAREGKDKPFNFAVGVAWQYDDNVVLVSDSADSAVDIADKGDSREVYTARAEYNKRFNERFGFKGQYLMSINKQNDLGFYDMFNNVFVAQPTVYFNDGILTLPISYNYSTVNDKAYLSSPAGNAIYSFTYGEAYMSQFYLKVQHKDYLWSPSMPDEDRDGNDYTGGTAWYWFFKEQKGFMTLRYALNREVTDGKNWDYTGNRFSSSVLYPVMPKLNFTVSGDVYLQYYSHTNSIFNIGRKDSVFTLSSLLAYKIYGDSELQLQYTYVRDCSNIKIYDYSRNIYSVGIEVRF